MSIYFSGLSCVLFRVFYFILFLEICWVLCCCGGFFWGAGLEGWGVWDCVFLFCFWRFCCWCLLACLFFVVFLFVGLFLSTCNKNPKPFSDTIVTKTHWIWGGGGVRGGVNIKLYEETNWQNEDTVVFDWASLTTCRLFPFKKMSYVSVYRALNSNYI